MELVNGKWEEVPPTTSPWLQVSLKPHRPSYQHTGIISPPSKLPPMESTATVDMGTRTCILPEDKATSLDIELCKVTRKATEATLDSWLDIKGGGHSSRLVTH